MRAIEDIKATKNLFIEAETSNDGMGGYYYDSVSGKKLNFIFSYQLGWEHLSVSMPSRTPTWEQMCRIKIYFGIKMKRVYNIILKKRIMLIIISIVYIYGNLLM